MRTLYHSSSRSAVAMFVLILLTAQVDVMLGTYNITRGKSSGTEESPCADDPDSESGLLLFTENSLAGSNSVDQGIMEELVEAIEKGDQVTVVGDIHVGVLDCKSLEAAEDAATLVVAISADELITAEKSFYTFISGDAFEDGIARKVWVGEEMVNDVMNPRRMVSITWGEVCNAETFLLKVTTTEIGEGVISVVKSIPCIPGASIDLCVVETEVAPEKDGPEHVSTEPPVRSRTLGRATSRQPGEANSVKAIGGVSKGERQLDSTTSINLMYLYTEGGKELLGDISDTQMQSTLATALATANEAMSNSGINLVLSLVYVGLLPYNETSTSSATVLDNLTNDEDVADMRDTYEADLVQLAADLGVSCGRAHLYTGDSVDGFSTVHISCFDEHSHTHEMGHNLGCYHNRDDSDAQTDYAHGYRYCNGTSPYRTIMSYPCTENYTIDRLNWFSNPDVYLLDKATGTSENDCARAIEENMFAWPVSDQICNHWNFREGDSHHGVLKVYKPTKGNLRTNVSLTCVPPVPSDTTVYLSSCSSGIDTLGSYFD